MGAGLLTSKQDTCPRQRTCMGLVHDKYTVNRFVCYMLRLSPWVLRLRTSYGETSGPKLTLQFWSGLLRVNHMHDAQRQQTASEQFGTRPL